MYKNLPTSILLLACLGMMIAGCASPGAKESDPNKLPKTQWGSFHGNMRWEIERKGFYNLFHVTSVNGVELELATETDRIDCEFQECKLRPGEHSIGIEYRWSTPKFRTEQRKQSLMIIVMTLGMLTGNLITPEIEADWPCKIELTFEAQSRHRYAINVVHSDQQEPPQAFQIVDIKSEEVITSMPPTCRASD